MNLRIASALVVVAVAIGGLLGAPAGASTRRVSSGDCAALENLASVQDSLSNGGSSDLSATADALTSTAKKVSDKKLKAALAKLAVAFKAVSKVKGDTAKAKLGATYVRKYAAEDRTVTQALISCATTSTSAPK
jgi:hypothetical protein